MVRKSLNHLLHVITYPHKTPQVFLLLCCLMMFLSGCMTRVVFENNMDFYVDSPMEISRPGTYILQDDIVLTNGTEAIKITSPDVILNGNFHTITCSKSVYDYCQKNHCLTSGVAINGSSPGTQKATRVLVKNLNIRDCEIGIYTSYPSGNSLYTLVNNSITRSDYGIYVHNGSRNTIWDNTVTGNRVMGMYISGSSVRNLVKNNRVSGNGNHNLDLDTGNNSFRDEKECPLPGKIPVIPSVRAADLTLIKDKTVRIDKPVTISASGEYRLQKDITINTSGVGIRILTSDVTLDGNFHTITCYPKVTQPGDGYSTGIEFGSLFDRSEQIAHATVKNLKIDGCHIGVFVYAYPLHEMNTSHTLENLVIVNGSTGIILHSGNGNMIRNTIVRHNLNKGIAAYGSDYNVFINNDVTENRNDDYNLDFSQNTVINERNVMLSNDPGSLFSRPR